MISKEKKQKIVQELVKVINESDNIIFTDFTGLTTPELNQLKDNLRGKGVGYKVTKKSLWPFVFKESGLKTDFSEHKGSVGIVYGVGDGVEAAKTIIDFIKKHETLCIIGAFLKMVFVGPDKIRELSKLPTREELLARFVYVINAPRQRLVGALGVNISNLVSIINNMTQIRK